MANTKRKPEETPKRSPGKSKFVFPKREAPPDDNTYFDRLFSELQQQKPDSDATTQDIVEISEASHFDNVSADGNEALENEPVNKDLVSEPHRLELAPETVASKQLTSSVTNNESKHIRAAPDQAPKTHCKPETSSYVDQLKLKYRLSKGEANVFRYLLGVTHDIGQGECYVIIPKLAEAASLTTRGCQLALKSLLIRGFVVRAEEYNPANKLGIKIQVNFISL
jgi:hypothetical protein